MDELTLRNFQALSQGLKEQRSKTSELQITINQLQETVGQLQSQLAEMQNQTFALLAAMQGNGATSN